MKLKSLLLGSAAALVAFSGARAADAVIAEPEPVEYVRVCDAYGAGFFYIPGTETCLQISGFVRYDININEDGWEKDTKAAINFDARSDTEMGTLRGYIALRADSSGEGNSPTGINGLTQSAAAIDEAYIQLGGFTIGTTYDYFDAYGIPGENDSTGGAQVNLIAYSYAANGFNAGVAIVDDNDNNAGPAADFTPNLTATAGFGVGAVNLQGVVAYDNDTEEFAGKLVASATVTEGGTLALALIYASGVTYTWDLSEWSVAGSYTQKVSDQISVSVGGQYWGDVNGRLNGAPIAFAGVYTNGDGYSVGASVDWKPVTNFLVRAQVDYTNFDNFVVGGSDVDTLTGKLRFQRSF